MDFLFKNMSTQQLVDALAERMRKGDNEVDHKSLDALAYYINVRNVALKLQANAREQMVEGLAVVMADEC
jgi:hypothetical protein